MTSEQRTSGSGGGYIKQRHSSQEGVDYASWMAWNPFMDGVEIYKTPLGHSWLRRGRSYVYQTTSGHGAKHVQSSHVSPEEGCYNMSGSFRTDYHIDFTGSTTGTADSSSGSVLLIIWRTRRRAWTRAGWTTVHLHPGRRAGGMSAGTGQRNGLGFHTPESASSGVRDFKG